MTIPQTSESVGNVLRLAGLKNVSGRRRVLPGAEFLNDLDALDTDVSGTANQMEETNLPMPEMGGELNAQSYDVRANQVTPPTQEQPIEQDNMFTRLGRALAAKSPTGQYRDQLSAQTPPIETQQVDLQEGLPPVSASQQEAPPPEEPGLFERFGKWFKKGWTPSTPEELAETRRQHPLPPSDLLSVPPILKRGLIGQLIPDTFGDAEKQQEWKDYRENQDILATGQDPQQVKEAKRAEMMEGIQKAVERPWEFSAYGAADEVGSNPELQQEFKEVTGVDYEPQIQAQISSYEEGMKGVEDALNGIQTSLGEQEEAIKQRILNNQATEQDKYYIGLALLLPLLIGGIFGKEAGLGALGGTAEGIAKILGGRGESIKKDEQTLMDIAKQKAGNLKERADMELNKAQLRPALVKNLPKQENEHLMGMKEGTWTNPETGKPEQVVRILPGFVAKGEYLGSKEGLTRMAKAAEELSEVKSYVDELDDQTNDVIYITSQLKDPSDMSKIFTSVINKTVPGALSALTQDVEFEGRMVNAGSLLNEKLGFIANAYAQAKQLGQLDRAAQAHMDRIINNPTSSLATPRDAINQMLEVRKLGQRGLVRSAKNKGFIPDFLQQEIEAKNRALYDRLNANEQGKRLEETKQKISRSGTTYAK